MLEQEVELAIGEFVSRIKESATYKEYSLQLAKLKEHPQEYQQVNEYRKKNFELQNTTQVDELFDKMYMFEKEYEEFRENPLVDDFLRAELAFCRMMQEIDLSIAEKLDFE